MAPYGDMVPPLYSERKVVHIDPETLLHQSHLLIIMPKSKKNVGTYWAVAMRRSRKKSSCMRRIDRLNISFQVDKPRRFDLGSHDEKKFSPSSGRCGRDSRNLQRDCAETGVHPSGLGQLVGRVHRLWSSAHPSGAAPCGGRAAGRGPAASARHPALGGGAEQDGTQGAVLQHHHQGAEPRH